MPTISFSERRYFYEERGAGTPLLLFHGFPFSSQSFWPQLEAPPAGVRLIVPDHRGFGRSDPGAGIATMEAMAEDGLRLLDALNLPSAVVGGVSMGGYVTQALTRIDPGRVRGLLLIDTQSTPDDEAGKARRETTAQEVERLGLEPLVASMLPRLFATQTSTEIKERLKMLMLAQSPAGVAAAARGMSTRSDGKDILSRFAGPCAIVVGADDVITPPEKARLMHQLVSGSTLEIIEGAGHLPHLEQPQQLAAVIERLIASVA
jgi:pimeloyl-ACP methyl ester carboxylesterase